MHDPILIDMLVVKSPLVKFVSQVKSMIFAGKKSNCGKIVCQSTSICWYFLGLLSGKSTT